MKLFDGRDQPVAVRVAQASFGLTMLTVAALFAVFMLLTLIEIPGSTRKANENAGGVLTEAIATDVNFVLADLQALGRSSLVWTSLSDSAGRDVYLKPYLETRSKSAIETGLLLTDYRARLVLGQLPAGIRSEQLERAVLSAMDRRAAQLQVIDMAGKPMLLAVEPVLYPYTKDAIGALVNAVDLSAEFRRRASGLAAESGAHLMLGDRMLAEHGDPDTGHFMLTSTDLALLHPVEGGPMRVEVYAAVNPWLAPIIKRLIAGVVLAVLLGMAAWYLAIRLGQRITARLHTLASHCEAGTAAAMQPDEGRDEIGLLRARWPVRCARTARSTRSLSTVWSTAPSSSWPARSGCARPSMRWSRALPSTTRKTGWCTATASTGWPSRRSPT